MANTLERQAIDLEASAHPALDELTAKVGQHMSHSHHVKSFACLLRRSLVLDLCIAMCAAR